MRQRIVITSIVVSLTLLFPVSSFAVKGTGGQAGAFMSFGAGARSLGMGKAFVALANDATATYWNPAGLSSVVRQEAIFLHAALWMGTAYDFLSYVYPISGVGTIGLSGTRLYLGGFEGRDEYNQITNTFEDVQSVYGLSIGRKLTDMLSLGANIKYLNHTMGEYISFGNYILDVGIGLKPGFHGFFEKLSFGLDMQNIFKLDVGEKTSDELPMVMRAGAALKFFRDHITLSTDFEFAGKRTAFHIGAEYLPFEYLAIRLGLDPEEFTLGFGVNFQDYGIDYAFATHALGGSHRISASVKFGPSIERKREVIARDYYVEARAAWESGKYLKAVQLLNKALAYDPKQSEWNDTLLKLDRISKIYPQATGNEKESKLIRRGVSYYLLGDTDTMLNALRYLLSLDPTNRSADELLRVIKKAHNITAPEVGTTKGMSLVEEKLYKCLNYFYDGKYNLVIKEAQEVLTLEPDNPIAYKRIGSAYFAIGDKKRAVKNWRKSLEINPSDEDLRDYIIRVEKEIGK